MKKNRLAVAIMFFINGFLYANWVSRLPEIQELWQVSNGTLGSILLCNAAGAIIAMPMAGWVMVNFSSRQVTLFAALFFCFFLPSIPLLPSLWVIFSLFFILGLIGGSLDVAMNGQAVYVERLYQKPILSSFHGVFSIGTLLGAGAGALFAKLHVSLFIHFSIVAAVCFLLVLYGSRFLVNDSRQEGGDTEGGQFRLPSGAILPLGIIAFCGMTGEGAMADWSALYMNKVIGRDVSFSALAFAAFTGAMTLGRVLGDFFIAKFGKRNVLIINSLLAFIGLSIVLLMPEAYAVLFGFFITGLGLSTVVPIIYSTAGNTEGVVPSVGIAMATTVGYAGFFIGPPVIGFISDHSDLRIGLLFALALFAVMGAFIFSKIKKF